MLLGSSCVQRLSAEVSGKTQKFSRIGACEFVKYEFHEYDLKHIKSACNVHFVDEIGKHYEYDVLSVCFIFKKGNFRD